jgi:N-acetylmuramoyl-L-alanine amidase
MLITIAPAHQVRAADGLPGKKICLDPGHGGSDPGAVNEAYGLHEADINLDVAFGLKTLLEMGGASVVMTRADDSYKTNSDRYTFCNDEQADILVSVHTNSTTTAAMNGSMALYFHKDDKALASAIHQVVYDSLKATALNPDNFSDFGLSRFASGVLLKSDMPAAMIEPLFMSYESEAELLGQPITDPEADASRRAQIARAIYQGVLSYYNNPEPPPEPKCRGRGCR